MGPKARSWPDLGQGCLCSYAVLSKRGRREREIKYVGLSCPISIYLTFMMEGYLLYAVFVYFRFVLFRFCFVLKRLPGTLLSNMKPRHQTILKFK